MIRIGYLFVYYLLILLIVLSAAIVSIASHPGTTAYIVDKVLDDNNVTYSRLEGSLLNGITLYDITYKDALTIKRFGVKYNLLMLLKPTPTIKKIEVSETSLYLDKLLQENNADNTTSIPAFALSTLTLEKTQVFYNDETLLFDLKAKKIHYRDMLKTKELSLALASSYADATLKGHIHSNRLYAKSSVALDETLIKDYPSSIQELTKRLAIKIEAGPDKITIGTHIDKIELSDQNISVHQANINLEYLIKEDYFSFNSSYGLAYGDYRAEVKQQGTFKRSGDYRSNVNADVTKTPLALPFKSLQADLSGNSKDIQGRLTAGPLKLTFDGKDYQHFNIHAQSSGLALSFIPDLPALFKKNIIAINSDTQLDLEPFSMKGVFDAEGLYNTFTGNYELDKDAQLLLATITPKSDSELWSQYPVKKFSPVYLVHYNDTKEDILNLDANILNLTLFKNADTINGWGNMGTGYFDTVGHISDTDDTHVTINAEIPSVHTLMSELGFDTRDKHVLFDAKADINTTMTLSDQVMVKSRIHLPWYSIQPDTQTIYQGENVNFESTYVDQKIIIDRYDLDIKGHHLYSQRPSLIAFDTNGSLVIDELWVYDNLLLTGKLNPSQMEGNLHLFSDYFKYESNDANLSLKADIKADFSSDGTQNVEGSITLLDGIITYEPKTDYTISDNVIIIQDIKYGSKFKRYVNIHVDSIKPIHYKAQNIDIRVIPDIILWQEPDVSLGIYGMVTIPEGEITGGGKRFEFDKSELYFNGAHPINPYLNLNMRHQTLDDIDIQIYITNTLSSPVIILTSNPQMSQDDIMSYILFGEPASSVFNTSEEGSKTVAVSSLLLATGLKQMLNDSTGVNIDTLNILTNEEGTLGYEIGTRFSKNIRVLYKSDTVSSVILQYKLSRSIRLDVDVHETGQGISILYVKDF